ncbi:MAG: Rha family transcriptional regulator [Tolypothrix brevis GSE-NOS-MK-07-07A]|jgi:phage regulator Rha-like protein|nr:Rha family transcriptional regulator [Tolypothrix brevis GSE-NOS-MK-07-07A]
MPNLAVVEHQGVLVVDSRLVAEELGLSHSTWMTNVIKKYQALLEANFGHLHFENGTVTNSVGAVNKVIFAWLMEDQATFLMTLSRNTQQVINAKIKLVKAFSEAKSRLAAKQVAVAPTTPTEQPALPPTPQEISQLFDLTLGQSGLDPKLVAGVKLSAIA